MAGGASGQGSGSGGSANKVALLLLGAGLVAIITIFGPRISGDGNAPVATTTTVAPVQGVAATTPASTVASAPTAAARPITTRPQLVAGGEVTLTIIAYGLPARISARAEDPDAHFVVTARETCTPDLYPSPCITDYRMNRDTVVVVSAGNAQAGYWPELDSVSGPGCTLGRTIRDVTCTLTMSADVELTAKYYGSDSDSVDDYIFPVCPKQRGANPPAWTARCR